MKSNTSRAPYVSPGEEWSSTSPRPWHYDVRRHPTSPFGLRGAYRHRRSLPHSAPPELREAPAFAGNPAREGGEEGEAGDAWYRSPLLWRRFRKSLSYASVRKNPNTNIHTGTDEWSCLVRPHRTRRGSASRPFSRSLKRTRRPPAVPMTAAHSTASSSYFTRGASGKNCLVSGTGRIPRARTAPEPGSGTGPGDGSERPFSGTSTARGSSTGGPGTSASTKTSKRGGRAACGNDGDHRTFGLKRAIFTEGNGIPVVTKTAPANRHELSFALSTIDAVRVGTCRRRPKALGADKGLDGAAFRSELRSQGIRPVIPPRSFKRRRPRPGRPPKARPGRPGGAQCWKVERTHAWQNTQRRIDQFYEKSRSTYEAFLDLACIRFYLKQLRGVRR